MSRIKFLGILFGALIAVGFIASILLDGQQIGDLITSTLMFITFLGFAGAVPFCLGFLIQSIFRKRKIPGYIAWLLSLLMAALPFLFTAQQPPVPFLTLLGQSIITFFIIGIFMNAGMETFRAMREAYIKKNSGMKGSS